jgi:hypothetical protein
MVAHPQMCCGVAGSSRLFGTVVGAGVSCHHPHRVIRPASSSTTLPLRWQRVVVRVTAVHQPSPDGRSGARSTSDRGLCVSWPDHPADHPDDPTGPVWIRPDRRGLQREQARSDWSRPVRRRAPGYASGGWGFESLAARTISPGQRLCWRVSGLDRGPDWSDLVGSSPVWWMIRAPRQAPVSSLTLCGDTAALRMAAGSTPLAGWWRR